MAEKTPEMSEALEIATKAGYILLENGAEISRVEETMNRIAKHFGVDTGNYFILSNGIFTTGNSRKLKKKNPNSLSEQFADVKYIPLRGSRLDKVVAVNQLSRDIEAGMHTIETADECLDKISKMPPVGSLFQIVSSGVGSGFFCSIFGGGLRDCAVSAFAGLILWIFVLKVSALHISKLLGNLAGSFLAASICITAVKLGLGVSLGHTIIGAVIPLIPGVAFTIGIRDIVGEDYIAGTTRLIDACVVFSGIAMGVAAALLIFSKFWGGLEL
jgi:uncharacterized membrane protein YjjP (DUF1212 family)